MVERARSQRDLADLVVVMVIQDLVVEARRRNQGLVQMRDVNVQDKNIINKIDIRNGGG
jgi:hypothetical protein